ncbi:MAG: hypothetical protein ACRYF5_10935, partial [Janthinobacterium lividum]
WRYTAHPAFAAGNFSATQASDDDEDENEDSDASSSTSSAASASAVSSSDASPSRSASPVAPAWASPAQQESPRMPPAPDPEPMRPESPPPSFTPQQHASVPPPFEPAPPPPPPPPPPEAGTWKPAPVPETERRYTGGAFGSANFSGAGGGYGSSGPSSGPTRPKGKQRAEEPNPYSSGNFPPRTSGTGWMPRGPSKWESGRRNVPFSYLSGLEYIGAVDGDTLPAEVLNYFDRYHGVASYHMQAYQGFCAYSIYPGEPLTNYLIVRRNLPVPMTAIGHPNRLVFPAYCEQYFITEMPVYHFPPPPPPPPPASAFFSHPHPSFTPDPFAARMPRPSTSAGNGADYFDSMPPPRGPASGQRNGLFNPNARPRERTKHFFHSRRSEPPPRARPAEDFAGASYGSSSRKKTSGGYRRPPQDQDGFQSGHHFHRNQGRRPGQPPEPEVPSEIAFVQREVEPLSFNVHSQIGMTGFKEGRMDPNDLVTQIVNPLKAGGLDDMQMKALLASLNLLLNFSLNDIQRIEGLPELFAEYAAEEKRKLKKLNSTSDMSDFQRDELDKLIAEDVRKRLIKTIRTTEEAAAQRKWPGSDANVVHKRNEAVIEVMADVEQYHKIADGDADDSDGRDSVIGAAEKKKKKRVLSHARISELKKMIARAKRDPDSEQSSADRKAITQTRLRMLNDSAEAEIDGRNLAFARAYLDHYYAKVFDVGLSSIAGDSAVRINILKLRSKLSS